MTHELIRARRKKGQDIDAIGVSKVELLQITAEDKLTPKI
jgi:hypothetical protein